MTKDQWERLSMEARNQAFYILGTLENDLIANVYEEIDRILEKGGTIETFRPRFEQLIENYGASIPAWRAEIILDTNISIAYAAGRWAQMKDPAVEAARPMWRYVPSSSAVPRPEHQAWWNLVLPSDHPFWDAHYPPNGWGCKCGVMALSEREVARYQDRYKGTDHPFQMEAPEVKTYDWTDKNGKVWTIPEGIDPGWQGNPGNPNWGAAAQELALKESQQKLFELSNGSIPFSEHHVCGCGCRAGR